MLEVVLAAKTAATLAAVGLVLSVTTFLVAFIRHRSLMSRLDHLVGLALRGQAPQARVQARIAGPAMKPLLDALGGTPAPPTSPPLAREVLLAIVAVAPLIAVPAYGLRAVESAEPTAVVPLVCAVMATTALLLPIALLAGFLVIELGVRSSRRVRAACVEILAVQVKGSEPARPKADGGVLA